MSIIAAGTTTTTALSSTGNTDGTLQLQVNGTTPSVTLNTLGAVGVGSTPAFGTAGQVLTSAGSTAAPSWTSVTSSQWTTTGSNIYYNTGNVGIGTSSPAYKLQVISGDTTQAARFQYAGNTSFQPTVVIRNTADGNSFISQLDFLGQNAAGTDQKAFIAAQMNTSGFAPNFIFGQTTGSSTYTEYMRISSAGIISDQNGALRAVPQSGSSKTSSYTLATTDVGEYILLGASGAIVIPDATFAAGDIVTIFNNTASTATITCTITTAYIAGTFTDKATMTLAAAGVATVLFITGTLCVVSGNVT
jgi:hypothetical protein